MTQGAALELPRFATGGLGLRRYVPDIGSMSGIRRFEELKAWQAARDLTREVYRASASGEIARDFSFQKQLRSAAVSAMANIAEGFNRARPGEFGQFLSIAKGSCAEVQSHLYVALDAGYFDPPTYSELRRLSDEAIRLTTALRASLRAKDR